jgi:hypothetical protein
MPGTNGAPGPAAGYWSEAGYGPPPAARLREQWPAEGEWYGRPGSPAGGHPGHGDHFVVRQYNENYEASRFGPSAPGPAVPVQPGAGPRGPVVNGPGEYAPGGYGGPPQYGPPQYDQPQYDQPQYGPPRYGPDRYGPDRYGPGGYGPGWPNAGRYDPARPGENWREPDLYGDGYSPPGLAGSQGYRPSGYEQRPGFGYPPGPARQDDGQFRPGQGWDGPGQGEAFQSGMRPPNPGYGYEHRAWPGEGYQPGPDSPAEPWRQAGRDTAARPSRPKGPPAALPAGSAAPENEVQHDGAGQATDLGEVASPMGKEPPPGAGLSAGATAGQNAATDDDTAPLPAMSFSGPDVNTASPAHNPASEHAERIASPGRRPQEPAVSGMVAGDQARASRLRDPFEPPDRQAIPGMAELAEEQRRSASRAASSPPTMTPAGQAQSGPAAKGGGTPQAASEEKPGPPGAAKMEQIKDLYLVAEALGEDALNQHFEQVSERQRQLIREYFDQVVGRAPDRKAQS